MFTGGGAEELVLNVNVVLGLADDVFVGILDAVLGQDTTAPVATATDDLCVHAPLWLAQRLSAERREWVMDVVTHGVFGALHGHHVLVLAIAASEGKPVEALVSLVLVALDEVPAKDKMFRNVVDAGADDTHVHVMPGHAAVVGLAELVLSPVGDGLEVHDAIVVVILTRPDDLLGTHGGDI